MTKIDVFLTQVPNVMEFADWVGRTKQKPIYVTGVFLSTEAR